MNNRKILLLDERTAAKIAAGEVVEKPAMIVKELFENAVDAGATEITVEIDRGGKQRIRVVDNGSGISRDDVPLAFARHATSKIATIDDLYYTKSFGFRGEALASICAVAHVTMITRTEHDDVGTRIVVAGGEVLEQTEIAATVGTSVEVTDLFFNTPVRLKFLKADAAEQKSVVDIMQRLAIANTSVSVRCIIDGEQIFLTDGRGDHASAIYVIFGRQVIRGMNKIQENADGVQLRGYASNFSNTRGNRNYQFVFVNGRVVHSEEVREAIALAYRPYLMKNNYPLAFLFIDLHPSRIDVNIHPAKTEIKFEDPAAIKQLIYTGLKKTFNLYDQIPRESSAVDHRATTFERMEKAPSPWLGASISERMGESVSERAVEPAPNEDESVPERAVEAAPSEDEICSEAVPRKGSMTMRFLAIHGSEQCDIRSVSDSAFEPMGMDEQAYSPEEDDDEDGDDEPTYASPTIQELFVLDEEPEYKHVQPERLVYRDLIYVGTLANSYLLYQKDGDLYLIDQHAAHEKILFERFMRAYREHYIVTQMLMFPLEAALHPGNRDRLEIVEQLGFHIYRVQQHAILVDGIPSEFSISAARVLLQSALDPAEPLDDTDEGRDYIAQRACKMAIKAHDVIGDIERDALISQLDELQDPFNCPHGRPIVLCISSHEIETRFRRIV